MVVGQWVELGEGEVSYSHFTTIIMNYINCLSFSEHVISFTENIIIVFIKALKSFY